MIRLKPLFCCCGIALWLFMGGKSSAQTISFVSVEAVLEFKNSMDGAKEKNSAADHLDIEPRNIGLNDSFSNPVFTGKLGYQLGGNSLTLKAERSIAMADHGSGDAAGSMNLKAVFRLTGEPNTAYYILDQDVLHGVLKTTVNSARERVEALAKVGFVSPISDVGYMEQAKRTSTKRYKGQSLLFSSPPFITLGEVKDPTDDLMWEEDDPLTTVNFTNGPTIFTTVLTGPDGEQVFQVSAALDTFVSATETESIALSDFYQTATLDLSAKEVPEPSTDTFLAVSMLGIITLVYRRQKAV